MANAEATATQNGAMPPESPPPEAALPVETLDKAIPFLRRPFTTAAVKFRVLAAFPKNDPNAGLVVAYIDARLAIERLNMVVGERWTPRYAIADGNKLMWCHLTVCGVERPDVGEGIGKSLVSDSLKRAGVQFGIGVSLYALPKMILKASDGHVKQKTLGGEKTLVLTPAGEERCRVIYDMWLDAKGRKAFGDPLDHGDALDAAGDGEAEGPPEGVEPETGEITPTLDPARAKGILGGIKALQLSYSAINVMLGACGADGLHANTPEGVEARISGLSEKQAEAVEVELERAAQDAEGTAPDTAPNGEQG